VILLQPPPRPELAAVEPVPPVVPTSAAPPALRPVRPGCLGLAARADRSPSDNGQCLALRYLATELNNTEFGLYYMNYHSRIPLFSGIKGTLTSVLTGGPLIAPICAQAALRSLCHTGTATYFAEFPEDIRLTGFSFNTQGPLGIALQGEYSYRSNLPLQYTTPELLLAALARGTHHGHHPDPRPAAGSPPRWCRTEPTSRATTAEDEPVPDDGNEELASFLGPAFIWARRRTYSTACRRTRGTTARRPFPPPFGATDRPTPEPGRHHVRPGLPPVGRLE
jgi:hypothetical protein